MALETLLVNIQDIKEFWAIDENINVGRWRPAVIKAQQIDLRPFLGDEFYHDFIVNFTDQKYQDLYNGGSFDYEGRLIYYSGVKQLLCAYSYARIYLANPDFVTRGGNVRKETTESTPQEQNITNGRAQEAESEAIRIQDDVWNFLDQNRNTYPLWRIRAPINAPKTTSFRVSKVRPAAFLSRGAADGY